MFSSGKPPCGGNIVSEGNFVTTDDWTADTGWTYVPNSLGASLADGQYRHVPELLTTLEQTVTALNGKLLQGYKLPSVNVRLVNWSGIYRWKFIRYY